jgi:large repetitive protein
MSKRSYAALFQVYAESVFSQRWMSLLLIGIAAGLVLAVAPAVLQAQTAHFSHAESTLNGGFGAPYGVAIDLSGNIYVGASGNNSVKKMPAGCTSSSCVTTVGGGFNGPTGVAVDASGNVYVGDMYNNAVKKIGPGCTSSDCVATLGGGFFEPDGVAVDTSGNVYVADSLNNAVKEIPLGCTSSGCVITLGGGFNEPLGVAVDGSGNVYVADSVNQAVKKMPRGCNSSDCVTTLTSYLFQPSGLGVDASGNIYVVDVGFGALREIPHGCSASSCVVTLVGGFKYPWGMGMDASGNVYVGDTGNNVVKEITFHDADFRSIPLGSGNAVIPLTFTFDSEGTIGAPKVLTEGATGLDFADAGTGSCTTNGTSHKYNAGDTCTVDVTFTPKFAGARHGAVELVNGSGAILATVYVYGTGSGPQIAFVPPSGGSIPKSTLGGGFNQPFGVAVDGSGNVYVANTNNNAVTEMPSGCASASCVTKLGGGFSRPLGVAVDGSGSIYIADAENGQVKKMLPGCTSSNCVSTLGGGFSGPQGVALDRSGNVYVTDIFENLVKMIPPGCASSNCVSTLGGGFSRPAGVALDGSGNVYVADFNNNAVKEMPPGCTSSSCVITLGGGFYAPNGVAVDARGNVYVVDQGNLALKKMPPGCTASAYDAGTCSVITLISNLLLPSGVALDASGNVYVTELQNNTVEEINRATPPTLKFVATPYGSKEGPLTATLENIGNGPLIFPVPKAGSNPSVSTSFTLDSATTCPELVPSSSEGMLDTGATCSLSVDFEPQTTGVITGSVTLTTNALPATLPIPTSGTGQQGQAQAINFQPFPGVMTYGVAPITLTATASSGLPVSYTVTGSAEVFGSTLIVTGVGQVSVTASQAGNQGYAPAPSVTRDFLVGPAPLKVAANDVTRAFGTANPTLTYTVTGFVNGETSSVISGTATLTTTATQTSQPGSYPITFSTEGLTATNYGFIYADGTLTIKAAIGAEQSGFTLTDMGAASQTVQPGTSATYTLQLAPSSGSYPGSVTFSATGLPPGATAVFSPSSLAANAGKQTVTFTVKTASSSAKKNNPFATEAPFALALLLLPALGLRRVRCSLLLVLFAVATFAGLASLSGCGGGSNPPPANYTITVTATSGQEASSVKMQLEVQ